MRILEVLMIAAIAFTFLCVLFSSFDSDELRYRCSKSGIEYVESHRGLSIHVNALGVPVLCKTP